MKYLRLYGFEHRRTQSQFEATWRELTEALAAAKDTIRIEASGEQLLVDGMAVESGQAERSFHQLLNGAQWAAIDLRGQPSPSELEALARELAGNARRVTPGASGIKPSLAGEPGNIRVTVIPGAADPLPSSPSSRSKSDAHASGRVAGLSGNERAGVRSMNDFEEVSASSEECRRWGNETFPLNERELFDALALLTRMSELGASAARNPELIAVEFDRVEDKIKTSVVELVAVLSRGSSDRKPSAPVLVRAAEQLATHYARERFESGGLKLSELDPLIESLSRAIANLRKVFRAREDKASRSAVAPESEADLLKAMFWAELPESSRKRILLSREAVRVPPRSVRQFLELMIGRHDRETAAAILRSLAGALGAKDTGDRARAAVGINQLADLFAEVGGSLLGETAQNLADAMSKEPDPEREALLSGAFLRLSSEAARRKQYRALGQISEAMEYMASRRPALERELRSRLGIEGRLPEFIEEALGQRPLSPDLVGVLRRNARASVEQLAERFSRAMRREECDRIVELVNELGFGANEYLREMLASGPQRHAVSSVGLLSRLDVPGLLEFLPLRLPQWNRFYHDIIVRQIAYGAASDRGRTLLEILEVLDAAVVPQTLDEIGMSGDRSAAPPLIVMAAAGEAQGRSPLLQVKAIEALGRLRDPDAVVVLKNLFQAKRLFAWQHHRELRITAAQALSRIDPRYSAEIMAEGGLEPGELALGPLDSAPACPWVRQRRYERIVLRKPVEATISSSWGKSTLALRELSLGGGMGTKEDALRIGSDADLDINLGLRHMRAQVLLRRARVNEVGFEFVNIDLESRYRVRRLLMDSLGHAPRQRSHGWHDRRNPKP